MKYAVMYRGSIQLRTDDKTEARQKLRELGDTAYIQYGTSGIAAHEATHDPVKGDSEK